MIKDRTRICKGWEKGVIGCNRLSYSLQKVATTSDRILQLIRFYWDLLGTIRRAFQWVKRVRCTLALLALQHPAVPGRRLIDCPAFACICQMPGRSGMSWAKGNVLKKFEECVRARHMSRYVKIQTIEIN